MLGQLLLFAAPAAAVSMARPVPALLGSSFAPVARHLRCVRPRMDAASDMAALESQIADLKMQQAAQAVDSAASISAPVPADVEVLAPSVAPAVETTLAAPAAEVSSISLPSLQSFPSLPTEAASGLLDTASSYVDGELLPIVAGSVLIPTGLFLVLLFFDGVKGLFSLFGSSDNKVTVSAEDSFDQELSAWPAILEVQREVEALSPEEQRRTKLETGTNWPPRTTTEKPFDTFREGYMFFQGPTPLTSVQEGMPSFLSSKNFEALEVPNVAKVIGGVFAVSFLATGVLLVVG